MRRLAAISTAIAITLLFLTVDIPPASAQTPPGTCVYSQDTGHNIHGAFWAYYYAHNGAENFGSPLTEAFLENGLVVQIFQRAKFEFRPDYPEPYRVQLSLLGLMYGVSSPPIKSAAIPPASNPNYRYFPATGQVISYQIKKYFDTHGGWELFGYPVSDIKYEGKMFVQYFQRARLEFYPLENRVVGSPVGEMALSRTANNSRLRTRMPSDWCDKVAATPASVPSAPVVLPTAIPQSTVVAVQVRVRFKQTGPTGPQYVEVSVFDQNFKPLPGIALVGTVHFANGDRVFPLLATDAAGRASFSFDIGNQPLNSTTVVEVAARANSQTYIGRDSFSR